MTNTDRSPEETWQELHSSLRDGLQREVHFTRELLSNMHQEELSLMLHDGGSLNQVLEQQFHLFERLSALRLHRQEITLKIEKIVVEKKKLPSIEEILPSSEEITTEILSLSDQLMALTERMNLQHSHNQHLSEHGERSIPPHFQPSMEPRAKRKASVATYHLKK